MGDRRAPHGSPRHERRARLRGPRPGARARRASAAGPVDRGLRRRRHRRAHRPAAHDRRAADPREGRGGDATAARPRRAPRQRPSARPHLPDAPRHPRVDQAARPMSVGAARIVGIGEVLWDLLPGGPRLGGAPFDATANLARLGHTVRFVSAVGDDELGHRALEAAARLGVGTMWIRRTDRAPTGTVEVALDDAGSPRFSIVSPAAYETVDLSDDVIDEAAGWDPGAIAFGTLAQRFAGVRASTRAIIERSSARVRLYDVNLRDGCWDDALVLELLGLATIVKMNDGEAGVIGGLLGLGSSDRTEVAALGTALADRSGIRGVCVTRGAAGASLWIDGARFEVGGIEVDVVDTVGAGDAFAAALLDGLLRGHEPRVALATANRLGAIVASRSGALPDWTTGELEAAGGPRR